MQRLTPVILATWKTEIGRIYGSRPAQEKSSQDPISANSWVLWHTPVIQLHWICKAGSHWTKCKMLFQKYTEYGSSMV
jgi:hypothetical protein